MSSGTAHSDLVTKARTSVFILTKSDFLLEPELIYSCTLTIYVQPNSLDGSLIRNMHINNYCSAVFQFLV